MAMVSGLFVRGRSHAADRKANEERGAVRRGAVHSRATAMGFADALDQRQTDTPTGMLDG